MTDEPPTSTELIDHARREGTIDDETAVLYSVYASFGDRRLPAEYAGARSPLLEPAIDLTEIAARLDSFSPQVREQLEPFLIAPMHTGSWWDLRRSSAAAAIRIEPPAARPAAAPIRGPAAVPRPILEGDWGSVLSTNGRVRVWYLLDDFANRQQASRVTSAIDGHIWPQLVALMGSEPLPDLGSVTQGRGDDDAIDIVLLKDNPVAATLGLGPNFCERAPALIMIDLDYAASLGVPMEPAIGHELMHAFQYALNLANLSGGSEGCGANEYDWWSEASATWAEDYLYPEMNSEHTGARGDRHVRDFMTDLRSSLDDGGGDPSRGITSGRAYGAYLWAYYVAQTFGDQLIGQMWRAMASQGALAAMETSLQPHGGFAEVWPDFAVAMLNIAPFDVFRQGDAMDHDPLTFDRQGYGSYASFRHSDEIVELGGSIGFADISATEGDFAADWSGDEHLAMTFNHYLFPDPDIRSVGFFNGMTFRKEAMDNGTGTFWAPAARPAEETRGMKLEALIRYADGTWEREDWTYYPFRVFCREVLAERITEVIVITTNSVPEAGYKTTSPEEFEHSNRFWVSDMGCSHWEGSVRSVQQDPSGFRMEIEVTDLVLVRDAAVVEPLGGGWYVNYWAEGGEMEWTASGSIGNGCTVSGSGTAPVRRFHAFSTANYITAGRDHRGAIGTLSTEVEQQYRISCPNETETHGFYPGIGFPMSSELGELPLGHEFSGTSQLATTEVTWQLVAVSE